MLLPFDEVEQLTAPAQRKAFEAQNSITAKITEMLALYLFMASTGDFVSVLAIEQEFERYYRKQMADFVKDAPNIAAETVKDYAKQSYDVKGDDIGLSFEQNEPIHTVTTQNAEQSRNLIESVSPGNTGFTERTPTGTRFTPTQDFFSRELNDGIQQVVSGNKTYTEVIRDVVSKMSNSGVRVMTSPNRTERIDVVVRRAIMTGIKDEITENAYEIARQMGTTFFEISLHDGARDTHWWGGYRFSTVPTDVIDLQTGMPFILDKVLWGRSGGDPSDFNCRHFITPVNSTDRPLYDASQIKAHQAAEKQTTSFKGKDYTRYQATQRMRALEREMRALRAEGMMHKMKYKILRKTGLKARELEALDHPYTEARLKYRVLRSEYADFADKMELKQQMERVYYDSIGRIF